MPEDVMKPWNLERITKGKIGEWVARDYYRSKGYVVWFLEIHYHGSFYSGTGKEYVNDRVVLTPLEKAILENIRSFDLLAVPENDVKSVKDLSLNVRYYSLLKDLFTVVIKEDSLDGLKKYLNLDLNGKIEFVKSKVKDIMDGEIKRDIKISIRDRLEFKLYGKLIWSSIEDALIEMENRHSILRKLRRVLVDVKTKWSEYDYPEKSVAKSKDHRLIEISKSLGFRCEFLEISFMCPEIRLKYIEL